MEIVNNNYTILLDDEDIELYNQFSWSVGNFNGKKYLCRSSKGNKVLFHRSVLKLIKGDGKIVDHIDGNSLNNCKTNLRICTQSENNRNRINKSVTKGYYFNTEKGKWQSQIKIEGKQVFLGRFDNENDAAQIYIDKCNELGVLAFHKERYKEMENNNV